MKYLVVDPLQAALAAGGCTLEPENGWWTFLSTPLDGIGSETEEVRDALYIPTLQKTGEPVAAEQIKGLKAQARELGFINETAASGMWVLSESGEVQIEYVWIFWAQKVSEAVRQSLPELAEKIKKLTNQDSVAYELGGKLNFV